MLSIIVILPLAMSAVTIFLNMWIFKHLNRYV